MKRLLVALLLLVAVPAQAQVQLCYTKPEPLFVCDGTQHGERLLAIPGAPVPALIVRAWVNSETYVPPTTFVQGAFNLFLDPASRFSLSDPLGQQTNQDRLIILGSVKIVPGQPMMSHWTLDPPVPFAPGDSLLAHWGCGPSNPAGLQAQMGWTVCWRAETNPAGPTATTPAAKWILQGSGTATDPYIPESGTGPWGPFGGKEPSTPPHGYYLHPAGHVYLF